MIDAVTKTEEYRRLYEYAVLMAAGLADACEFALQREIPVGELVLRITGTPIEADRLYRGRELLTALLADGGYPRVLTDEEPS